jgi:hypothetical protein
VRVVNDSDFTAWVNDAKQKFSADSGMPKATFAAAGAASAQ